ncbi:class I SAM-dependent methyltransferase [Actinoplanes bogorensis]|uniref:Class I SAM-dependent methyltransferase n=1 Tax=Paractinoplanes bogorensis TaxID=1610840 RepID=A0ABS5YJM8_9ACTN|nr:class I SAM-dependent methyltransferase [Actinoplanes bogorensis]MBU2662145.1 class I SAM-dependent methyltransferase [Actinoplanes bogorensis]
MIRLLRLARLVVRRCRGLSRRQLAALIVVLPLALGVGISSMIGRAALATGLLAVLLAVVLTGVIHLSRRIGGAQRSTQEAVRDLHGVVDQLQRRVIAALEKERLAAGDRHQELTEAMARTERLTGRGAELLLRDQSLEIEALMQLFQMVTPRAPMPSGMPPTDLLGLVHVVRHRRPGLVVALGGGPATVWLGYAVAAGGGRLVTIDHDAPRASRVRSQLGPHGLARSVDVRHVGLAELSVDGRTVDWFDVEALDGLTEIDLLVVDGSLAPGGSDPLAPALHVLGRRLAEAAAVVVDDEPTRVAPRQGGGFGLTVRHRLPGRWTALTHPETVNV